MNDFTIDEIKRSLSDFAWQVHVNPSKADKKINGYLLYSGEKWKDTFFYFDSQYNTAEFFDNKSGFTATSDVLEFDDKDKGVIWTGKEPEGRSWPALLDIGVMGHCNCGTIIEENEIVKKSKETGSFDKEIITNDNFSEDFLSYLSNNIYKELLASNKIYSEESIRNACDNLDANFIYSKILKNFDENIDSEEVH